MDAGMPHDGAVTSPHPRERGDQTPPGADAAGRAAPLDVVPLDTPELLTSLWHDVLDPSFPAVELLPLDGLLAGHRAGVLLAYGIVRDGRPVAGIVGSWSPASRVLLVDYLATAPGGRGRGVGGALLRQALDRWRRDLDPVLVLAEVEHPTHHATSESFGDPPARMRFYARHGARALPLPYFQPGIAGPGSPRVAALILVVLDAGDRAEVDAGPLRSFLVEQLFASEGTVSADTATRRLLDAAAGGTVALVDPADGEALARVPVGVLEGPERFAPSASPS
jgi:GNAT superfamily N-acetyltransferase